MIKYFAFHFTDDAETAACATITTQLPLVQCTCVPCPFSTISHYHWCLFYEV